MTSTHTNKTVGRASAGSQTVAKLSSKVGLRSRSRPTTPAQSTTDSNAGPPSAFGLSNGDATSDRRQPRSRARKLGPRSRPATSASLPVTTINGENDSSPANGKFRRLSSDRSTATKFDYSAHVQNSGWHTFIPPAASHPAIQGQPLPVRLGLVPPCSSTSNRRGPFGSQLIGSYYLHTPPPPRARRRSFSHASLAVRPTSCASASASASSTQVPSSSQSSLSLTLSRQGDEDESTRCSTNNGDCGGNVSTSASIATVKSTNRPGTLLNRPDMSLIAGAPATGSSPVSPHGRNKAHFEQDTTPSIFLDGLLADDQWHLGDYFTFKKKRVASGGFRQVRYHAFPRDRVPYFLSHDQSSICSELYAHNLIFESLSFRHSIIPWGDEKPIAVLDLGTGTGAWCMDAARDWKTSEFIGLDVVPIQTPIDPIAEPDLARRVSWVVANFLDGLPFPNHSFDFVHIRRVGAMSIGEDQWPTLLSEIVRVLKPDGQLELLEFNWNFAGNLRNVSLQELASGFMASSSRGANPYAARDGMKSPTAQGILKGADSKSYAALEDAFERVMTRRFLNPRVLSLIPGNLTTQDFRDIRTGNPRRIPLTAKSDDFLLLSQLASAQPASAQLSSAISPSAPSQAPHDPSIWAKAYTTRPQVGNPLAGSGFFVSPGNLSLFRSMCIVSYAEKYYSARDLLWDEEEEAALLSESVGPQGGGRTADATAYWALPWRHRRDFDWAMDSYYRDMVQWADMGTLVKERLGWKEGEDLESVAERKLGEKQRKLNIGVASMANLATVRQRSTGAREASHGSLMAPWLNAEGEEGLDSALYDQESLHPGQPSPLGLGFQVGGSAAAPASPSYWRGLSTSSWNGNLPDDSFVDAQRDAEFELHAVSLFDESGAHEDESGTDGSAQRGECARPSPVPSSSSLPMRKDAQRILSDASPGTMPCSPDYPVGAEPVKSWEAGQSPSQQLSTTTPLTPPCMPAHVGLLGIMETTGFSASAPAS